MTDEGAIYSADCLLERSRARHRACAAVVEALRWSRPDLALHFRHGSAEWAEDEDGFTGVVISMGNYSAITLADFTERVRALSKLVGSAPLAASLGDEHGASWSSEVTARAVWDCGFAPPIGPARLRFSMGSVKCPVPPRRVEEVVHTKPTDGVSVRTTYLVQRDCIEQVESLLDESP